VYGGTGSDTGIAAFSLNESTGALTPVAGSPFAGAAIDPVVTPAGTFLYAVGGTSTTTLVGYSIATATGALTPLAGSPFATGINTPDGLNPMLIDGSGKFLYEPSSAGQQILGFSIAATGALTPLTGSPFATGVTGGAQGTCGCPEAVVIDPSSKFLFVGSWPAADAGSLGLISVFTIGASGALTPVAGSPFASTAQVNALAVDPATKYLYGTQGSNVVGYTIGASGALTPMTGSPFPSGGSNAVPVAVNAAGTRLYVGNNSNTGANVSVFSIGATGALTSMGTVDAPNPEAIAFDSEGKYLFVSDGADNLNVFSVDAATGALTITSGSPYANGSGWGVPTVP
jgi:6-phosphogluconolactonase